MCTEPTSRLEWTQLLQEYQPRIRHHVLRYSRLASFRMQVREELESAALLGFVDAVNRLDASRSDTMTAYLDHRIRGAIRDELRSIDPMSRSSRTFHKRLQAVRRVHYAKHGCEPTLQQLSETLGLSVDELQIGLRRLEEQPTKRIEEESFAETLFSTDESPEQSYERRELREQLQTALELLPERLQTIVSLYYLEDKTLLQIAQQLQVTESRVCQLLRDAHERLRQHLSSRERETAKRMC